MNRTAAEVELFWVNTDGERQSYGKLNVGAERAQHTFAGHVWLATDATGKTLAVFQAEERNGVAEITTRPAGERPRRSTENRRRPTASRDTSPDGKWRAFIKDDNLMVRSLEDGEEVALSSDGKADDAYGERVYWSPDSKRLVGFARGQGRSTRFTSWNLRPRIRSSRSFTRSTIASPATAFRWRSRSCSTSSRSGRFP